MGSPPSAPLLSNSKCTRPGSRVYVLRALTSSIAPPNSNKKSSVCTEIPMRSIDSMNSRNQTRSTNLSSGFHILNEARGKTRSTAFLLAGTGGQTSTVPPKQKLPHGLMHQ